MISLITCDCGSAEGLIRQALHKYEYKCWATEPIAKGKNKSLAKVEELIRMMPNSPDLQALFSHVKNNSKWCVIIGYDGENAKWSDISRKDMKSDIEAEAIVGHFS